MVELSATGLSSGGVLYPPFGEPGILVGTIGGASGIGRSQRVVSSSGNSSDDGCCALIRDARSSALRGEGFKKKSIFDCLGSLVHGDVSALSGGRSVFEASEVKI